MAGSLQESVLTPSLYVGDLHFTVTEGLLYEIFSPIGQICSLRICRDAETDQSLGYGFVNFSSWFAARKALADLNFTILNGKPIRLMWCQRDPSLRKSGKGNVFINNLDKNIDNKTIFDAFSIFGKILSCKISLDHEGNSKGFAFVHFQNAEDAKKAISKGNGMLLKGKPIYVGNFIPSYKRATYEHPSTSTALVPVNNNYETDKRTLHFEDRNFFQCEFNGYRNNLYCPYYRNFQGYQGYQQLPYLEFSNSMTQYIRGSRIFITNLDDFFDEDKIYLEFCAFGTISSVEMCFNKRKKTKFAFVSFATVEEAKKAVNEMNGKILGTQTLHVALAYRNETRKMYQYGPLYNQSTLRRKSLNILPQLVLPSEVAFERRCNGVVNNDLAVYPWSKPPPIRLFRNYYHPPSYEYTDHGRAITRKQEFSFFSNCIYDGNETKDGSNATVDVNSNTIEENGEKTSKISLSASSSSSFSVSKENLTDDSKSANINEYSDGTDEDGIDDFNIKMLFISEEAIDE